MPSEAAVPLHLGSRAVPCVLCFTHPGCVSQWPLGGPRGTTESLGPSGTCWFISR